MSPSPKRPISVRRGTLATLVHWIFTSGSVSRCTLLDDHAALGTTRLPYTDIVTVSLDRGLIWASVRVRARNRREFVAAGLARADAGALASGLDEAVNNAAVEAMSACAGAIATMHSEMELLRASPRFVTRAEFEAWLLRCRHLIDSLPARTPKIPDMEATNSAVESLRQAVQSPEDARASITYEFVEREVARERELFDTIAAEPLTDEQRRAVVIDESRTLVVAAAGSGKTAAMVGKAAYLLRSGHCTPDQLLLLAFARNAAEELRERLVERLVERLDPQAASAITATTFHALGLKIIGQVEGTRPRISREAEDHIGIRRRVREATASAMTNPIAARRVLEWFRSHFAPYRSELEFRSRGEYLRYVQEHELRSLAGDLVRSYEECEIANFLYLNSVPYEYEPRYPHEPGDAEHGPYTPDFHLPAAGVYIEHFGISRGGATAPFVDRAKYAADMEWKRSVHQRHDTQLVETYSYEKSEGTLLSGLAAKLEAVGVVFKERPMEEAFAALEQLGQVDHFTSLTTTFLRHFKSSGFSVAELRSRASASRRPDRAHAYLDVFEGLVEHYARDMSARHEIDFEDMISRATAYASDGRYASPFRYVLVDEFQDISRGRARLLKALLDQHESARLFAVGDDWQSIYRFAGADVSLMTEFASYFGTTERADLSRTFRCVDRVSDVATAFVTRNAGQLAKSVRAARTANTTRIHVGFAGSAAPRVIRGILAKVSDELGETSSVLLLGRYRSSEPADLAELRREYPRLDLKFLTIHRSKGLEADAVIVLGLNSGSRGFPSEARDDPLLDLVLAHPELFRHAEERRLLYVAMTRARHAAYLLVTAGSPSEFIEELVAGGYDVSTFGDAVVDQPLCPDCATTRLALRESEYGHFWGCLNFPLCRFTKDSCRKCKVGWMASDDSSCALTCKSCGHVVIPCPDCGAGQLLRRDGPHGPFLGCSAYPRCRATRPIARPSHDSPLT